MKLILTSIALAVATGLVAVGCGSDEAAQNADDDALESFKGPSLNTSKQDGYIVEKYTLDDDDTPDVIKQFEVYPDPEDESVVKRRLRKKDVDVNSDGTLDIRRVYNKNGTLIEETMDIDLDGNADTINYFDADNLVKKERLSKDASRVVETRYYSDDNLIRVEKDANNDQKIDYWEYYEQGTIDRIGRDINADGRADSWTHR